MEQITLTTEELDLAEKLMGWSEEQKKTLPSRLTDYQKRFIRHWPDFFNYKIIQEVIWSSHCPVQAKPGDKIVYSALGDLIQEESSFGDRTTFGYCFVCVMAMLPFFYTVRDRICSGFDDPSPAGIDYVKCIDIEPRFGGTGSVFCKIYCVKSKVKVPPGLFREGVII
jgi:hypothetical protein